MMLRRVALPPAVAGGLWLSSMPGRDSPMAGFLAAAAGERIGHVLCLAGPEEIGRRSPDYAAFLATGDLPWSWRALPIPDFGVPEDEAGFAAGISDMAALLRQGGRVVVHCAAGIGRTGMAALCLLLALGLDRRATELGVRSAGSFPETAEQLAFVNRLSAAGPAAAPGD